MAAVIGAVAAKPLTAPETILFIAGQPTPTAMARQPSNCDATPGTISARTLRGAYGPTDSMSQLRSDVRPERRAGPAVRRPDDHLHALPETVHGPADGRR